MDRYKQLSQLHYGECNYCDYLICYKRKKNCFKQKQGKPCQVRRKELKSKMMKSKIRQNLKKDLNEASE